MLIRVFLAWLGMMVLAVLNGGLRDVLYKPHVGELAAHQISTVSLLIVFFGYFWLLDTSRPVVSSKQAWTIGTTWLVLTLAFETILGHFIIGQPWSRLLQDYDIFAGRVWILIPLWTLVGPYVMLRLRRGRR